MPRGDTIRELDEQMAALVRRAVDDLRVQMRRRLEEATAELQQRLGEVAPDLPESFISDDHIRRIAEEAAEEAAGPTPEELEEARESGRAAGRLEARGEAHGTLRAALAEIDRARSQGDVLSALLAATATHAERAAILLARGGRLIGWGARGFESEDDAVRGVTLGSEQEPWAALVAGGPSRSLASAGSAGLVSQLDSPLAHQAFAVPMVLRDRVAAVVYADRASDAGALDVDAVQVLAYAAALALETLAFRDRELTATLRPAERPHDEEPAAPAPAAGETLAPPSAASEATERVGAEAVEEDDEILDLAAPEEDGPVTVDDEPEVYELPAESEFELEDVSAAPAVESGVEAELETELEAADEPATAFDEWGAVEDASPETGSVAVDELAPEEALAFQDGPGEIPTRDYDYPREVEDEDEIAAEVIEIDEIEVEEVDDAALDATAIDQAPELDELPSVDEIEVEEPEVEIEAEEDEIPPSTATVAWSPRAVPDEDEADEDEDEPAAASEDTEEAEVEPAPAPPASASGPVEPPADVQGPGWAFSAPKEAVSEDQEAVHEEARRLARLLVSEIQLYNQDEVEEGRRNRDIYERLRDDIDRSRQLYEERVDPQVRESTDYFYQELVRQLAAGDAKALGI